MALILKIKTNSTKAANALANELHKSLVGSPGYINSEILLSPVESRVVEMIIGNNNSNDLNLLVKNNDIFTKIICVVSGVCLTLATEMILSKCLDFISVGDTVVLPKRVFKDLIKCQVNNYNKRN